MTGYERIHIFIEPFLPLLQGKVRGDLRRIIGKPNEREYPHLLDIGGRKSPYTLGLPARITVLDLPRQTEVQENLHLGLTKQLVTDLQSYRSNIRDVILQDMTCSTLPSEHFDGAICVEVIEHVPQDGKFLEEIARVLKPGGWLYVTTPNGDYVKNEPPNYNPDHLRHYKRGELLELLSRYFESVTVNYGIKTGKYRKKGLRGYNFRRPFETLETMFCNVISHYESRNCENQSFRTAHLFALAQKAA